MHTPMVARTPAQHKTFVAAMNTPKQDFRIGFRLYADYRPAEACANDTQRRGWLAALKAESDSDTMQYLASRQPDIADDYEDIRRGN